VMAQASPEDLPGLLARPLSPFAGHQTAI